MPALIQELDCGDITTLEYDLTDGRPLERKHIVTTPAKICGVLGITVPEQTMIDILQRLEFTVDVQADGSWDVSAPLYREDVESFPDLAEEVIREYGYDHIKPHLPEHCLCYQRRPELCAEAAAQDQAPAGCTGLL